MFIPNERQPENLVFKLQNGLIRQVSYIKKI
jgi:hypothetical protein